MRYSVWVSFYEIYNEFLYDLLDGPSSLSLKKRVTLRLSDDKHGNPYVKGERTPSAPSLNGSSPPPNAERLSFCWSRPGVDPGSQR